MRFEILRLDDVDGSAVDSTVVDAASVKPDRAAGRSRWPAHSDPTGRDGVLLTP